MPEENKSNEQNINQNANEKIANWEEWINKQPDDIKGLYQGHVTGLQNTVKATRDERDALKQQIKDLLPKAEKGSELEKSLTDFSTKLEVAERRATFVEEAIKPEIGCRNPKAAYALASADNLFDRRGNPDWTAIKAAAPELFGAPSVNGNAGAGTDKQPPKGGMNEFIRRAAGRE